MATGKVGFVKQHRSIMNTSLWYGDSRRWKIYTTILLMVNWNANTWTFKGEKYELRPGQTVTSYDNIREQAGSGDITYKLVRNTCKYLHDEGFICLETTPRKSIKITMLDWEKAQGFNQIEAAEQGNIKQSTKTIQIDGIKYLDRAQDRAQETDILIEGETPTGKRPPALGSEIGAQFGAQFGAHIEEGLRSKEEAEIAKTMPTAAVDKQEKGKVGKPSPDEMIVELYHKLRKEYHKKESNTSIKTDIDRLQKSERRSTIIADGFQTVGRKIRGWFEYTEDWKEENNYPFAAFCKQYTSIREVQPERICTGSCSECGSKLYEGEKHKCIHIVMCDDCNTGIRYIGKKRDDEILQAHIDERGCNRPES